MCQYMYYICANAASQNSLLYSIYYTTHFLFKYKDCRKLISSFVSEPAQTSKAECTSCRQTAPSSIHASAVRGTCLREREQYGWSRHTTVPCAPAVCNRAQQRDSLLHGYRNPPINALLLLCFPM